MSVTKSSKHQKVVIDFYNTHNIKDMYLPVYWPRPSNQVWQLALYNSCNGYRPLREEEEREREQTVVPGSGGWGDIFYNIKYVMIVRED